MQQDQAALEQAKKNAEKQAKELENKLQQAKEALKKAQADLEQAKTDLEAKKTNEIIQDLLFTLNYVKAPLNTAERVNLIAEYIFKPEALIEDYHSDNPENWMIEFKDIKTENLTDEAKRYFYIEDGKEQERDVKFLVKKQQN